MSRDELPLLQARHLSKTFAEKHGENVFALQDISVAVRRSEFVSVIGPSGCGKSTFLRIVAGLEKPTAGHIEIDGKGVSGPGADRGMVFQEYALFPWKTVQANIEFGPYLKGVAKPERSNTALRFIDLVGLSGFENKYPHQLSGGMRQRAAVARALANSPKVLLMDEPFAAVDAMTRRRLQQELMNLVTAEGTTVLFVTHSVDEAAFLSDRIVVLSARPGRVLDVIIVDIPRPRHWSEVLGDNRFAACRDRINQLIGIDRSEEEDFST